jgi:hypothetical protein
MIFRASGKWVSGPRSILATRPGCAADATPGAAAAKKAKRPLLQARAGHGMRLIAAIFPRGHVRFGQTQKGGVNATVFDRVCEADFSMLAAASRNRRATAVLRGSVPATAKVKPSTMSLQRSKRLKI